MSGPILIGGKPYKKKKNNVMKNDGNNVMKNVHIV